MKTRSRASTVASASMWWTVLIIVLLALAGVSVASPAAAKASEEENDTSSSTIIGIDLGTTYSCVGAVKKGQIEIIANDQGNRITPSYVAWDSTGGGERLIGDAAKHQATLNPENTVFDIKRLIGRQFDDRSVQADLDLLPFKVVNKDNTPRVQVMIRIAIPAAVVHVYVSTL